MLKQNEAEFSIKKKFLSVFSWPKSKGQKLKELNIRINDLKFLCDELDPYQGPTDEQKVILKKYNILTDSDPFTMTNQILVLMEDALEEQEKFKIKS